MLDTEYWLLTGFQNGIMHKNAGETDTIMLTRYGT